AQVTAWPDDGSTSHSALASAKSDANGRFELRRMPLGTVRLDISGPDDRPTLVSAKQVQVSTTPLAFTVPAGAVELTAVDAAGNPIPHAELEVTAGKSGYGFDADAKGSGRIQNLPAGEVKVSAEAQGYERKETSFALKKGETRKVTLQLRRHP